MRVLVITPWLPTRKKPATGTFTVRDIELLRRDHEVTVFHLAAPGDLTPEETPAAGTIRQPYNFKSPRSSLAATRQIRKMLPEYDLVHTMAMSALFPTAMARPTIPWVHTEHFSDLVNPGLPWHRKALLAALSTFYRFPSASVAVGKDLAAVIDKHRTQETSVIGNYVNFPAQVTDRTPRQDPRLLAVGGLIHRKGPLESVQTLAELHDKGVHATLTWVGSGPLKDQVQTLARRLSVEEFLHLPGFVDPGVLSRYFEEADLFFLPTEAETFGVVFAEALAHGLPVVTTGVGGHTDFLPPNASRVADNRRPETLATAIQDLLGDPQKPSRSRISREAARVFSEEERRVQYANVYAQASSQTGP